MNIELDLRTLSLTLVFFSAVFGVGMIVYGKLHKSFVGIKLIGVGHLFIGVGYILLGMRHTINDFTSIVIANSIIYIVSVRKPPFSESGVGIISETEKILPNPRRYFEANSG